MFNLIRKVPVPRPGDHAGIVGPLTGRGLARQRGPKSVCLTPDLVTRDISMRYRIPLITWPIVLRACFRPLKGILHLVSIVLIRLPDVRCLNTQNTVTCQLSRIC